MIKLESYPHYNRLLEKGKYILLFSADWCPDCRVIEPILPEIEARFSEYSFIYVDRNKFLDLYSELDVFGIPSFIAIEDGKELGRFVSKDRKTKEEIEAFIAGLK